MIEAVAAGDLVWVPSAVKLHSQYARSLVTKVPRNFLVTSVENRYLNVLIDGEEWTVDKVDAYPSVKEGDGT